MKVKDGFILRKLGKQYVVVATGAVSESFHYVIRLDESGAYAFELLKKGINEQELLLALVKEYSVSEAELQPELKHFLDTLRKADVIA